MQGTVVSRRGPGGRGGLEPDQARVTLLAQVGLSPKRFSEVVRFERACALLAAGAASLAEVAVRAGHYDQARLSRDVRALAGTTPAILAAELASVGPVDP